jgi:multidrug resistance efflux pump
MNHYMEAVMAGVLTAVLAGFAGIGAGMPAPAMAATQAASAAVEVRPLVSGRVVAISSVQDQEVGKGTVLMDIDPLPYQSAFNKAQINLTKAQWRYQVAVSDRTRATRRVATEGREALDASIEAADRARDAVETAKAALAQAQLNLAHTRVTAPVAGTVGHVNVGVGTQVSSGQTSLMTVLPAAATTLASN